METTFGPAYSAVTTITKGECISCIELLPKALGVIPTSCFFVVVVLQIIKLLGESLCSLQTGAKVLFLVLCSPSVL